MEKWHFQPNEGHILRPPNYNSVDLMLSFESLVEMPFLLFDAPTDMIKINYRAIQRVCNFIVRAPL